MIRRMFTTAPRFSSLSGSKQNNFDFLRFLLAVIVLHYHSFPIAGQESHSLLTRLRTLQFGGGWVAVNCFFIISGFLICGSWQRSKGLLDYLSKRFLRIYPGFVVAVLFCVFVIGPLTGAVLPGYFVDPRTYAYFKPLILGPVAPSLPGVLRSVPWAGLINGSLWTIRFEILCYFLLAVLGVIGCLRHRAVVLVALSASLFASLALQRAWPRAWVLEIPLFGSAWEMPRFLSYFLAGMSFYLYRERIPHSLLLALFALVLLGAGYALRLESIFLPVCGSYLIFYIAFARRLPFQHFGAYGDFSYGIYLYAFPLQQLLVCRFGLAGHPLLLTATAFPITLIVAMASWRLVEQPFLRLKSRTAVQTGDEPSPIHLLKEAVLANRV